MNKNVLYIESENGITDKFGVKPVHPPSYKTETAGPF